MKKKQRKQSAKKSDAKKLVVRKRAPTKPAKRRKNADTELTFDKWEAAFRATAAADGYALFRKHLRQLELRDEPLALLEGTIKFLASWQLYFEMDQRGSFEEMLRMQTYDPAQATGAEYAFTFDLCGKAYARVLIDTKVGQLDLADMNGAAWYEYKRVGYDRFWVSRVNWKLLDDKQRAQLEDEILDDLHFEYGEDEIDIVFDHSRADEYMVVDVRERRDFL